MNMNVIRRSDYLDLLHELSAPSQWDVYWRPAADVYRCRHGWLLKFELAGVAQEDVSVRLAGSRLIVSGTRRDIPLYERQEAHMMEIAYSHFERTVELPEECGAAEIRTEYRDGMLVVHVLHHP
jgi:HSP20 family protein